MAVPMSKSKRNRSGSGFGSWPRVLPGENWEEWLDRALARLISSLSEHLERIRKKKPGRYFCGVFIELPPYFKSKAGEGVWPPRGVAGSLVGGPYRKRPLPVFIDLHFCAGARFPTELLPGESREEWVDRMMALLTSFLSRQAEQIKRKMHAGTALVDESPCNTAFAAWRQSPKVSHRTPEKWWGISIDVPPALQSTTEETGAKRPSSSFWFMSRSTHPLEVILL